MSARAARGLFAVAGLAFASSAIAGPIYSINPAEKDEYGRYSGGHALWMPDNGANTQIPNGSSSTFLFVDDSGVLEFSDDLSSATMTGQIMSVSDPASVWTVSINFVLGMSNPEFTNPAGHTNPLGGTSFGEEKRELINAAYTENGGPIDPAAWRFYYIDDTSSTLTGVGGMIDGVVLDITQRPDGADYGKHVLQVGEGANGKNIRFGASTWFNYTGAFSGRGDINIDLKEIPTPGAGALAVLAAGLAGVRRKR